MTAGRYHKSVKPSLTHLGQILAVGTELGGMDLRIAVSLLHLLVQLIDLSVQGLGLVHLSLVAGSVASSLEVLSGLQEACPALDQIVPLFAGICENTHDFIPPHEI